MPSTTYMGYEIQTTGSNSGTWGSTLNTDAIERIDSNFGAVTTKSLSSSNVTLSTSEARAAVLRLIGTITANIQVTNGRNGFYFVENLTTGSFTVTVTNGVSGVTIPQSSRIPVVADTTNGVRRIENTALSALDITGATAETAIDTADEVPLYDVSATANRKATVNNLMKAINTFTTESTPDTADVLALYDTSAATMDKATVGSVLAAVNTLTEDTAPSPSADFLLSYDTSASSAKKIKPYTVGRWVLLNTLTASSSSSLVDSTSLTSTYQEYMIIFEAIIPASFTDFNMKVSTDGGSNYQTTQYLGGLHYFTSGASSGAANMSTTQFDLSTGDITTSSTYGYNGTMMIYNPSGTSYRKSIQVSATWLSSGGAVVGMQVAGMWNGGNSAINALSFQMDSGNITSGTIYIYGMRNA